MRNKSAPGEGQAAGAGSFDGTSGSGEAGSADGRGRGAGAAGRDAGAGTSGGGSEAGEAGSADGRGRGAGAAGQAALHASAGAGDRPVAVVLGAAVWPGGEPSPTLRRRAEEGARLWLEGRVRLVVASGGIGRHAPAEAEVISEICQSLGVPAEAILLEARSTTTEENLLFARPLLEAAGARRIVIVTDRFHLPRARLVARRLGLSAQGAWPRVPGPVTGRRLWLWLREGGALAGYAVTGRGRR